MSKRRLAGPAQCGVALAIALTALLSPVSAVDWFGQPIITEDPHRLYPLISIEDLDGDLSDDFIVAAQRDEPPGGKLLVFLSDSIGGMTQVDSIIVQTIFPVPLVLLDEDHDERIDLIASNPKSLRMNQNNGIDWEQ
jgi:hypothetical protein